MTARSFSRRAFLTLCATGTVLPLKTLANANPDLKFSPALGLPQVPTAPLPSSTRRFQVYDALSAPQSSALNLSPVWIKQQDFFQYPEDDIPNQAACHRLARWAMDRCDRVVINVEAWKVDARSADRGEIDTSIDRFGQILHWMKQAAPALPLGIYAYPPIRDYWTLISGSEAGLSQWRQANDALQPLAQQADFIAPSLQTFYDDLGAWKTYATLSLAEAQRFEKPVIPLLSCRYPLQQSNPEARFVSGALWQEQLKTVQTSRSAGVILWDAGHPEGADRAQAWWQATLDFVESLPS